MAKRPRARYSPAGLLPEEGSIPGPVYEALPIVYLVVAVVLVFLVESPVIFVSSALFGAAGVWILMMRARFRRDLL